MELHGWTCAAAATAVAATICALAMMLAAAIPAAAAVVERFGSFGAGAGQFNEPFGIAIDRSNGGLYVLDTNNQRIEEFTGEGAFQRAWGWGVAGTDRPGVQVCTRTCVPGVYGAGAGQFGFAEGIAADDDPASLSYGDLYVVDISNHRVEKFSPAGAFLLMFGGEVNQSARERHETAGEDICPVRPGDICSAGTRGSGPGQFEFPVEGHLVAVGADGTVYVGDRSRVEEFAPNGSFESQVKITNPVVSGPGEAGGVSGLEVNAAGDLYVIRIGVRSVNEYEPSGRLMRSIDPQARAENSEGPTPVAALDAAGDTFIEHEGEREGEYDITELDPTGATLATLATKMQGGLHGIAYDNQTGLLYVLELQSHEVPVIVFEPPDPPPFAATGSDFARLAIPEI
jgi:DNA-binding beta-propeller fold protein YncE